MFNLLVTADENGWSGQPTNFALSRCVREYTDAAITERFGSLDEASAAELMRIPSVFAYEEGVGKAPKFGRITGVSKRSNRMEVRVDYEFINLPKFLTNEELWSMGAELDLGSWESPRTHWAVKDVDLSRELLSKGVLLPAQFASQRQPTAGIPRVVRSHVIISPVEAGHSSKPESPIPRPHNAIPVRRVNRPYLPSN
ncbi:hypothetical protein [Diaphorobacter aerolatus]|uniref:Uncharacterized protein n=1 Tax=Diaphorobacter aerolatus TaxID=1288495 RepID=A0A7H0GM75_9BURK|nr:hypothetical protein [Diaphorobacter aerolatus]QNP49391.1 hypothetical protein H9K75_04925 [Diaphorobacter aerolatus]